MNDGLMQEEMLCNLGSKHPLIDICGLTENHGFKLWILFYTLNILMCYLISNKIAQFSNVYHSVIKF